MFSEKYLIEKDKYAELTKLYGTEFNKLKNYLGSKFQINSSSTEDLTQEIFTKAFENIDKFNPTEAKMAAWVYRIGFNTAIDLIRKRNNEGFQLSFDETWGVHKYTKHSRNPEELLVTKETIPIIKGFIDSQSNLRARVARKRYIEEKSYKEIREELNTPMGTIQATLHHFRKKAQKSLSQLL